jgi:hypothetical protein
MIRDRLGMKLYAFAEERKLGLVSWETDFQLSEATVRIPDLSFIRAERLQELDPRQRPQGVGSAGVSLQAG